MEAQFVGRQRVAALELLERIPWGDFGNALYTFEAALALALEALGPDATKVWDSGAGIDDMDEFLVSSEQIAAFDDELRLSYVARMIHDVAFAYGVTEAAPLGRSPDGSISSPLQWNDAPDGLMQLVRGLNDIRGGLVPPETQRHEA